MFLPDVNLWLAIVFESHVHHAAAKKSFESVPDGNCAFCRLTQQGFLRLAFNPRAFGDEAVTLLDAWRLDDKLLADPRLMYSEEPAGMDEFWRHYTERRSFSPKVWSDAFLAAFARAAHFDLVTFNSGMKQYEALQCSVLD